jgi:hypothetical protein
MVAAYCALVIALDACIVVTYSIHNIYNYLTPAYAVLCVLIGVACAWIIAVVRDAFARRMAPAGQAPTALVAALLLLLPAALAARNHAEVDRSADYSAYDFARTTLERLPARAVVMTDSWSAPPFWYLQLVEGERRDVLVSPVFSSPGDDPVAFARRYLDAGRPVYVADGLRTRSGPLEEAYTLQPVVLNVIQTMLVDTLPKPRYRDDLVPRGSLYRLTAAAPDPRVAVVPAGATRKVAFPEGVTLVGFEAHGEAVDPGSVIELTYYWRADRAQAVMPAALTLFADGSGGFAQRYGWPTWSQSRMIAQGVLDAPAWEPGSVIAESYFVLVPRGTAPGVYSVRLSVYPSEASPADAHRAAIDSMATVGEVTVR